MSPETRSPAQGKTPLRVLIVDDDPMVRAVLCGYLTHAGHAPHAAGTMQEALSVLQERTFDVLVTDVLLPDGDGINILNDVAEHTPAVRLVAVTGGGFYFGPAFFERIAHALGAVTLQKPFERESFLAAVEGPLAV
jgi:DNA-binding NtrC family response regulator